MSGAIDFLTTSGYAYIPDDPGFDLTADAEWRLDLALDSWANGTSTQYIATRYDAASNERLWRLFITSVGALRLGLGDGNGAWRTDVSFGNFIKPANNERVQIRITLDADDGSGNTVFTLYERRGSALNNALTDNTGWTLVQTKTIAGIQSWAASTKPVWLATNGDNPGISGATGKYHEFVHWSDITQTTKVCHVDFTDEANAITPYSVWDDLAIANNWTMNGTEGTDYVWDAGLPSMMLLGIG